MYVPDHFAETDMTEIRSLVDAFPLATCVTLVDGAFSINHFPVVWEDDYLLGHIAKANDLHNALEAGGAAVFIFQGQDSYISPNWYPSKPEHHKHVPTWNYQVVHMHGDLVFDHDKKSKLAVVGKLTNIHEQRVSGEKAWKMRDAPKDYLDQMLENIVAFRFKITKIEAKSKLSQNRESKDFSGVMNAMKDEGLDRLATAMKKQDR